MTEAASNALLFEQEIDERVVAALMRALTNPNDTYGVAADLVNAFLQRPELQILVERRCDQHIRSMQEFWMYEGAKKYAASTQAEQPYVRINKPIRW